MTIVLVNYAYYLSICCHKFILLIEAECGGRCVVKGRKPIAIPRFQDKVFSQISVAKKVVVDCLVET
jgi:hypothetical protein